MKLCFGNICCTNWWNFSSSKIMTLMSTMRWWRKKNQKRDMVSESFQVSVWKTQTRQGIFFRWWPERQGFSLMSSVKICHFYGKDVSERVRGWGEEGFVCAVHKGGGTVQRGGERIRLPISWAVLLLKTWIRMLGRERGKLKVVGGKWSGNFAVCF